MLGERFSTCLQGAQSGNEDAFALLFRDLEPFVTRYLKVLSSTAAEDVAADTWLEVVRGLRRFSGDEAGFRAWVLTIARHRHADRLRSQSRRLSELPLDLSLSRVTGGQDAATTAEENISTEEALALIATLPPPQAEVVVLRAVVGLSVAEVASIVGRERAYVRVLAHRGLRRLAQLMLRQRTGGGVAS